MAGNRTLEDFLDRGDDGPSEDREDTAVGPPGDGREPPVGRDGIDAAAEGGAAPEAPASDATGDGPAGGRPPLLTTYAWSPEGAACEACEAPSTRRWRDGDRLVCASCKDW